MDAKDFFVTVRKECERNRTCDECKFLMCCVVNFRHGDFDRVTDMAIEVAEKLNHKKTFCEDFFEKHPYATKLLNGRPTPCRNSIYTYARVGYCCWKGCKDCWNEPYYEPEEQKCCTSSNT